MPEFILNTSGAIPGGRAVDVSPTGALKLATGVNAAPVTWSDLDAFTQGYIEAAFFTETEPGTTRADRVTTRGTVRKSWAEGEREGQHKNIPGDYGFADLAPETLARMIADCAAFQGSETWTLREAAESAGDGPCPDDAQAGRDFWYTRNGHGCGFWDGDWPEPYASELTDAAKAFGEVDAYLGDDGRVYL